MIFRHVDVVTEHSIVENCTLTIKDGKIHAFDKELSDEPNRFLVVPGFIDQHIHVSSAHFKASKQMLYAHGVTSFLPTVATTSIMAMTQELTSLGRLVKEDDSAVGIHLEGPFINKEKAGAQSLKGIRFYKAELLDDLIKASNDTVKILTFAPEMVTDTFYQSYPKIHKQIGHSNASINDFLAAYNHGVRTITHVFNGLPLLHHRHENILLQCLLKEDMTYELIADQIHVSLDMIKFFLKQQPHVLCISDALCDPSVLGDKKLTLKGGHYYTNDDRLAGSNQYLDIGFKTLLEAGLTPVQAVHATSTNQSKYLGLDAFLGKVKVGYQADLVLLDKNYTVHKTIKNGHIVFERR